MTGRQEIDDPAPATFAERFGNWWDIPGTKYQRASYPYPQEEAVKNQNREFKVPGETTMPWTWERFQSEYPDLYKHLQEKRRIKRGIPPYFEENILTPEQIEHKTLNPRQRVEADPTVNLADASQPPADPARVDPTSRFAQWLGAQPKTPERGLADFLGAQPVAMRPSGRRLETGGGVPIGKPAGEKFTIETMNSRDIKPSSGLPGASDRFTPGRWEEEITGPYRFHSFTVKNEKGASIGEFQIDIDGTPDQVAKATKAHVGWASHLGAEGGGESWTIGPRAIFDIIRQLKKVYPNLQTLESERVTGGRAESGKAETKGGQKATFDISKYAGAPWIVLPTGAIAFGAVSGAPSEAEAAPGTPQDHTAPDYDYAGAKAAGISTNERGHWPDTYKLPNHITFSDESKYSSPEHRGGKWEHVEGNRWRFTPGPENLRHHSMEELRQYFKEHEPESTLVEPQKPGLLAQAGQALMQMPEIRGPAAIGRAVGQVGKERLDELVGSIARSLGAEAEGAHSIPDLMNLAGTALLGGPPISRAAGTVGHLGTFAATKGHSPHPEILDNADLSTAKAHIDSVKEWVEKVGGKANVLSAVKGNVSLMSWEKEALTKEYGSVEAGVEALLNLKKTEPPTKMGGTKESEVPEWHSIAAKNTEKEASTPPAKPEDISAVADKYPRHWKGYYEGIEYYQKKLRSVGIDVSPEGVASLHFYTGSGYRALNRGLREGDLSPRYKQFHDSLLETLNKFPTYEGTTWRGLSYNLKKFDEYVPGFEFTEPAFMSSASNQESAFNKSVRFVIAGRAGRDLVSTEVNADEYEVLHLPNTRFRVIDREFDGSKLNIYLEELE